mmetsp:Transcript_7165/g.17745  ORF Transcript_7165/g.17745 Transcript_7165/m.17745 type:complete len:322 (+) Transcript_7165:2953-3918(+)
MNIACMRHSLSVPSITSSHAKQCKIMQHTVAVAPPASPSAPYASDVQLNMLSPNQSSIPSTGACIAQSRHLVTRMLPYSHARPAGRRRSLTTRAARSALQEGDGQRHGVEAREAVRHVHRGKRRAHHHVVRLGDRRVVDGVRHLLRRLADGHGLDGGAEGLALLLHVLAVERGALQVVRLDHARVHGADVDAQRLELRPDGLREAHECVLGRGEGRHVLHGHLGVERVDHDDGGAVGEQRAARLALRLLGQQRRKCLRHVVRANVVDLHQSARLGHGHVQEGAARHDARVVDHHVDVLVLGQHRAHHGAHLLLARHVAHHA